MKILSEGKESFWSWFKCALSLQEPTDKMTDLLTFASKITYVELEMREVGYLERCYKKGLSFSSSRELKRNGYAR